MALYEGGCHCGAVRYEAEADLSSVIECNCSQCAKKGFLLSFAPRSAFTLKTDRGALSEYTFNTGKIRHLFCNTCGVQSFAEGVAPNGDEIAAINVRCLDGVDIAGLSITPVNGKDF
jgi:hypothetical protein